jgi:FAD/FMN-containing dehydrogenase
MPNRSIPARLKRALSAALEPDDLILEGDDLAYYGADRCKGGWPVAPGAIALPRTREQVVAIVRACAQERWAIVPSGGRTGLAGAATATDGELVLSLARMSRVHSVDAASRLLRCDAGVTVESVQEAAHEHDLLYPIDFAAKGSAHIGGTIATNAGGVRVLHYGLTRQWVQGLEVVLADGSELELGGELVKDNTGYDLRQAFIGSEGTLGIIVGATLRLCSPPSHRKVALCALASDAQVLELFARVRAAPLTVSAFECFDRGCVRGVQAHRGNQARPFELDPLQHVLIEVIAEGGSDARSETRGEIVDDALMECLGDAAEAGVIEDAVIAASGAQERALWAWREDISESLHARTPHKADISVPVSRVSSFLDRWRQAVADALPEIPAVCFGHVGDGNLHLNLLCPDGLEHASFLERVQGFDETVYGLVEEFGGSVSAEHGIGLLKRAHLHHSRTAAEIALMRGIKSVFDPEGLMNPGKIWA